ncbi:MAG TPA: FtsQ-type POTRA domain-containing protein [Candidatus Paceibacterota bacterium]|nr:FtsQ-type POTRA domain-containing protein [Verrucomicrobiota bacterium]HSA11501.1 FtsQ-type POTRA domain-containing protein [Candidatus Paceibacterota bacterium]
MTAVSLGTVFTVVFGLYLLYRTGEWALNRLLYENKSFAIEKIEVQTDGIIAVDQLRRWAGVKPGENLLELDLARVRRDLEMVPLVHSASVERILPRTLRICVEEREPIAQVNIPRPNPAGGVGVAIYHLDAEGWVIMPLDPRQLETASNQPSNTLPVVAGVSASELQPGRRITSPPVQAALRLILAFDQSPMAGLVNLRRIDVSSREVLVVTTEQGSVITLGLNDVGHQLDRQLRRWHTIFELGQQTSNAIATLDLAVTNNIPVRWLEASTVLPAAPKPAKPSRSRKKHV